MTDTGSPRPKGGARPGAGRPRNKSPPPAGPPEGLSPLEHLMHVMNDPAQSLARRARAAIVAAPFCHPKATAAAPYKAAHADKKAVAPTPTFPTFSPSATKAAPESAVSR